MHSIAIKGVGLYSKSYCYCSYKLAVTAIGVIYEVQIITANTMEPLAKETCVEEMKKVAERVFENPSQYIANNPIYLQQCTQKKLEEEATAINN